MIRAAISFFILAINSFVFGTYGIAGVSADIGRAFLVIFLALAGVSLIASLGSREKKLVPYKKNRNKYLLTTNKENL